MGENLLLHALSVPLPTLPLDSTNEGPILWVAAQLRLIDIIVFPCTFCYYVLALFRAR